MQTRKKVSAGNGVRHLASPRCRPSRKLSEQPHVVERKVTDLITSSGRKQRLVNGIDQTKDTRAAIKLSKDCVSKRNESQEICLPHVEDGRISTTYQKCDEKSAHCTSKTIFSPTFHIFKDGVNGISKCGDAEVIRSKDQVCCLGTEKIQDIGLNDSTPLDSFQLYRRVDHDNDEKMDSNFVHSEVPHSLNSVGDEYGNDLSSEVSAIYLAMKQSKLECIEESSDNSMSVEVCVETDEDEEVDNFDPYLFIKQLPDLSAVVPTFRPMLLPKKTRSCPPTTLVLDLDETLVHSSLDHCEDADFTFKVNFNLEDHTVYVRCRPYLKDFMERVASLFEIIVFTASQSIYAEQLLNVLDPKRKLFRHRVFRESCVYLDGNYLKDLSVLGRDLARVIIVDNSPQAFGFQVDNGIPIESWFCDPSDHALLDLLPFLESLVGVQDVRPAIANKFNLREKVASAVDLYSNIE